MSKKLAYLALAATRLTPSAQLAARLRQRMAHAQMFSDVWEVVCESWQSHAIYIKQSAEKLAFEGGKSKIIPEIDG